MTYSTIETVIKNSFKPTGNDNKEETWAQNLKKKKKKATITFSSQSIKFLR